MKSMNNLLMSDIDNTLTGDDEGLKSLISLIEMNKEELGFGVATGRSIELAKDILEKHGIVDVDIYITSVGSEIYYTDELILDKGWAAYIRRRWYKQRIMDTLQEVPELELQREDGGVRDFKVSYNIKKGSDVESLQRKVKEVLALAKCPHNAIFSHDSYLDILPYRANKGLALKYIAWKWDLNPSTIISAGDSGNDRDMLISPFKGIVVANHEQSLEDVIKRKNIYLAKSSHAQGLIEGLMHHKVVSS